MPLTFQRFPAIGRCCDIFGFATHFDGGSKMCGGLSDIRHTRLTEARKCVACTVESNTHRRLICEDDVKVGVLRFAESLRLPRIQPQSINPYDERNHDIAQSSGDGHVVFTLFHWRTPGLCLFVAKCRCPRCTRAANSRKSGSILLEGWRKQVAIV